MGTAAGEELIRAVYASHGGELLRFATHLTGDPTRAQDVVQETLIRAWRHPEALDGSRGSPRGWLFTVARNVVVDLVRAEKARPRLAPWDGVREPSTDGGLDRAVESWELAEAVSRLSPEHREVLTEVHLRGRSVAEAAAVLGIPAGTVKSRTFYALRALRLALEERGFLR